MLTVFIRGIWMYVVLIGVIRLLGKRQLGQMEPSEVVVTMVVADLAANPMQDENLPLMYGLVPIAAVLLMEMLFSRLSMGSIFFRKLLCGKPVILIENGKLLQNNMKKNRITLDELISQLREKDVLDLSAVQFAILETGGNLSVFPYPEHRPATAKEAGVIPEVQAIPYTVVSDGKIFFDDLKKAGKDRRWLEKTLQKNKASLKETLLLTVDSNNNVRFYRKEQNKVDSGQ